MISTREIRVGTTCYAQVRLCHERTTPWLLCKRVCQNTVRVVAHDPVWQGCRLSLGDKDVSVVKDIEVTA